MSDSEEFTWVSWYCSQKGKEFFCEVREWYYTDNFNLTGLSNFIPYYSLALSLIRSEEYNRDFDQLSQEQIAIVDRAAEVLYGLIHARFIVTTTGIQLMLKKYRKAKFGTCPRVYCENQPTLPIGLSDIVGQYSLKLFCPRCQRVYIPTNPEHRKIDGAYFGTTFAHSLLNSNKDVLPFQPTHRYIPRIYGFKLSKGVTKYRKSIKVNLLLEQKNTEKNEEIIKEIEKEKEKEKN
ncbi:casein kinase ii subunit beta [Anaeramoeba flamelloides]|uniref:Casein kinase II subunit beta n=1 Tax=Anaeramoeba flamelloides TaxID=1746091 RepID=A0AAV7ZCK9_9EUKA|nr:casein kinase ii subunit beta [Anaeramoeba flamelloides]KAJ6248801.1 casein kinase ii subunit beta [Anaeramoeba flamelloides]